MVSEGGKGVFKWMLPGRVGLPLNEQRIKQTGVGINYYIKEQNIRMTLEYLDTEFDKETILFGITDGSKADVPERQTSCIIVALIDLHPARLYSDTIMKPHYSMTSRNVNKNTVTLR